VSHVVFQNKIEMKNFAYDGEAGLREPAVKQAVAEFLRTNGYTVTVGKERERGPDIRATKEGINLIIEAKGEGSRSEMFNNYFLNVLGEILQRRSMHATDYGIALPAHAKFARLIDELDDGFVRYHLRLNFYLVHKDGTQVGFLKWDVK
jgi:hypothetical protein